VPVILAFPFNRTKFDKRIEGHNRLLSAGNIVLLKIILDGLNLALFNSLLAIKRNIAVDLRTG
jgi:hypothetical protein